MIFVARVKGYLISVFQDYKEDGAHNTIPIFDVYNDKGNII